MHSNLVIAAQKALHTEVFLEFIYNNYMVTTAAYTVVTQQLGTSYL